MRIQMFDKDMKQGRADFMNAFDVNDQSRRKAKREFNDVMRSVGFGRK